MQTEYEKVSLANLAGGAAVELVDAELARVFENIADPNTKIKEARTVTLTLKIVPTEDRQVGAVTIKAASKLAGMNPRDTYVEFVQEGRKQVAYQKPNGQRELPLPGVSAIKGA